MQKKSNAYEPSLIVDISSPPPISATVSLLELYRISRVPSPFRCSSPPPPSEDVPTSVDIPSNLKGRRSYETIEEKYERKTHLHQQWFVHQ